MGARKWSDLNIEVQRKSFVGNKISLQRLEGKKIIIQDYKVVPSTKNDRECLHLQILYDDEKRVLFTGSGNLIESCKQLKKEFLPVETVIKKDADNSYSFT